MKTIREIFSENLRRLRGTRTQAEIAERARVPLVSYSRAENGDIPQAPNLAAIARAFGLQEGDLFVDYSRFSEGTISPDAALEALSRALNLKAPPKPLLPGATSEEMDRLAYVLENRPDLFRYLMDAVAGFEKQMSPSKASLKTKSAPKRQA